MTKQFMFACRGCQHSAVDHSSKTGPKDMKCHRDDCDCEKYDHWFIGALTPHYQSMNQ